MKAIEVVKGSQIPSQAIEVAGLVKLLAGKYRISGTFTANAFASAKLVKAGDKSTEEAPGDLSEVDAVANFSTWDGKQGVQEAEFEIKDGGKYIALVSADHGDVSYALNMTIERVDSSPAVPMPEIKEVDTSKKK